MLKLLVLLFTSILCFCHSLPASVSEAHSAATQQLHLYIKNSTSGVNSQLAPIVAQLRQTNEQVEVGRDAILPFLTFLFDTLGSLGDEIDDCLDDMMIQLIPDDPSDPGYPTTPPVVTEPLEPPTSAPAATPVASAVPVIPTIPVIPPDTVKTDVTPK